MLNYTERVALLMEDIVDRVSTLSFIDLREVLVFARSGRSGAEGAFATCHCLTLPPTDPGYYFWRDRHTGELTRRSEWFVTKSPEVRIGSRQIKYLISFVLPRFCDQTLARSRKLDLYPGADPWLAKLDTVVHELYHIDPDQSGIRRFERADGTHSPRSHGPDFYEQVARMVRAYLATRPDPRVYDFLMWDFRQLEAQFGGLVGTTFSNYPSYPQRYPEPLRAQPLVAGVRVEPVKPATQPTRYSEDDLTIRHFTATTARRLIRKGQGRAA
jgi:hypothetical protein